MISCVSNAPPANNGLLTVCTLHVCCTVLLLQLLQVAVIAVHEFLRLGACLNKTVVKIHLLEFSKELANLIKRKTAC